MCITVHNAYEIDLNTHYYTITIKPQNLLITCNKQTIQNLNYIIIYQFLKYGHSVKIKYKINGQIGVGKLEMLLNRLSLQSRLCF